MQSVFIGRLLGIFIGGVICAVWYGIVIATQAMAIGLVLAVIVTFVKKDW